MFFNNTKKMISGFLSVMVLCSASVFGLTTIGPVVKFSDGVTGADFLTADYLSAKPGIEAFILGNTTAGVFGGAAANPFGPGDLTVPFDGTVRTYFIQETGNQSNQLGFTVNGLAPAPNSLIFDRIDSADDGLSAFGDPVVNPPETGLQKDDYVDMGNFSAGTQLGFYLVRDGADTPLGTFWSDSSLNGGAVHFYLNYMGAAGGSEFYLISAEDLPVGLGSDYDDLHAVVQVGVPIPEPGTYVLMGSFLACAGLLKRRKKAEVKI